MLSITLTQISYIIAVSKTRNFSLAAESCNVTQPTLSMQIQKLEDQLGVIIFDRSKKPVEPTPIGQKIIEQAKITLQEGSRIEELIKEERGEIAGELNLGIIPTLTPYLLPLFLQNVTQKYPRVELVIEELQTAQIVERLKDDSLDAGVLITPLRQKGIIEKPIFYEPFVVYLSANHPLFKLNKISEKELSSDDVWLLNDGHCLRNQVIELCKKKARRGGKHKNVTFESGNLETLKRLVDKNFGYTLLPHLATQEMPEKEKKKKLRFFKSP
ncbi:MAG: LysR substrate-binding domain-containing protein, partial [Nitrospinales bacterium]